MKSEFIKYSDNNICIKVEGKPSIEATYKEDENYTQINIEKANIPNFKKEDIMSNEKVNLVITREIAKAQYPTATPELKAIFNTTFGKDFFVETIMDKLKNYVQANSMYYDSLTPNARGVKNLCVHSILSDKVLAYFNALVIVDVLNEGWKLDYEKIPRSKYDLYTVKCYIAYNMDKKSFVVSYSRENLYGIPLMFKSDELAQYFIDTFPEICNTLYK